MSSWCFGSVGVMCSDLESRSWQFTWKDDGHLYDTHGELEAREDQSLHSGPLLRLSRECAGRLKNPTYGFGVLGSGMNSWSTGVRRPGLDPAWAPHWMRVTWASDFTSLCFTLICGDDWLYLCVWSLRAVIGRQRASSQLRSMILLPWSPIASCLGGPHLVCASASSYACPCSMWLSKNDYSSIYWAPTNARPQVSSIIPTITPGKGGVILILTGKDWGHRRRSHRCPGGR